MKKKFTAEELIEKAHLWVNLPVIVVPMILIITNVVLAFYTSLPYWSIAVGAIVAVLFAIVWHKSMLNYWKKWAIQHAENFINLKHKAIMEHLIKPDDPLFNQE